MAIFQAETIFDCSVEKVWEFLIRPALVAETTPPDMKLSITQGPEKLELGSELVLEIKAMGQTQQSQHEIVVFDPPRSFTERQVKGPLKSWEHDHILEAISETQCKLTDRILFDPPGGLVGLLMNESRIQSMLAKSFEHRSSEMKRRLENET